MGKNKNSLLARGLGNIDGHIGRPGRYAVGAAVGGGAGAAVSHFTNVSPWGMGTTALAGAGAATVANVVADLVVDKEQYLEEKTKAELSSALKTLKGSKEVDKQSADAIDAMLEAM
jgi:hypothetical protein